MKIIYPDIDKLLEYHEKLITIGLEKGEGGSYGFLGGKDRSDLESIIHFIQSDMYYPSFEDKITHLMYALNKNHIFSDGNKRASIYLSSYFLSLNTFDNTLVIKYIRELEDISIHVANNKIGKDLLLKIITSLINYYKYDEELQLEIYNAIKE